MRFLPAGPSALLVELSNQDEVLAFAEEVARRREGGWGSTISDVVPGARTVLLDGARRPAELAEEIAGWTFQPAQREQAVPVEVQVRYDGPDLADVAAHWGVSEREVGEIHASLSHRVAFCGFSPGFAYIDGLGERWKVPRRPTPRPQVPGGSVAVGGAYTGVYPRSSPGGWQLIGHTDLVLWDDARQPPALLGPGTPVRFTAR
ncbi:MAG TPA: allophanate hydrolase subunit 1 [Acidimicrobiales bacterium]|nr:allophanate hydrolase subunit 1 [Acidimicrobiales bacterium]